MRFSRARYVTLCQQSLVTAAVLAVGVSAAGVKTLDIVPQPGHAADLGAGLPGAVPRDALADQSSQPAKTEVDTAPVTPKVREVKVAGISDKAPKASTTPPSVRQLPQQERSHATEAESPKRVVALSEPEPVRGYATVGVTWRQGVDYSETQIDVEVRTEEDGKWSQWMPAAYHDDHGPDTASSEENATDERPGTDALVVGDVDRVQMRTQTTDGSAPTDLRLAVVDPGKGVMTEEAPAIDTAKLEQGSSSAEGAPAGEPQALSGSDAQDTVALSAMKTAPLPKIYKRSQWGANERMREQSAPDYGTVKAGFIHHTVNSNSYSSSQVPSLLRGIYAYHTQSRGWRDIGYNFLVDRFGRIWEGRYGGVTRAVVGAHTSGYNEYSFALSAIGNYDVKAPPSAVLTAYAKLFAWKLSRHNVRADNPRVYVRNRYFRAISGHRDAGSTACPGRYLYAKLPSIRTAAQRIQTAAQTTTPSPDPAPAPAPTVFRTPTQKARAAVKQPTNMTFPRALNLADDANPDLVVRSSSGAVSVLPTGGQTGYRVATSTPGNWSTMDLVAAVGDVTGDGRGDVMARLAADSVTRVYAGDGAGRFAIPGTSETSAFEDANLLAGAGDWNRDGHRDVLMRAASTGYLWLVPGRGDGTFGSRVLLSKYGKDYEHVAVMGDVSGDGRPELAGMHTDGYVYVARSTSAVQPSGFVKTRYLGSGYDEVVGADRDLSGDGVGDLVIRAKSTGTLKILVGLRSGGFARALGPFLGGGEYRSLSGGQVMGSAHPDVVAVNKAGTALVVLEHNGMVNLKPMLKGNLSRTDITRVHNVGDWNGDGEGDVITRQASGDALVLRPGRGDGTFAAGSHMSKGGWKSFIHLAAVGDVTGDGDPDLIGRTRTGIATIFPGDGAKGFEAPIRTPWDVRSFNQIGSGVWKTRAFLQSAYLSSDGSFVPSLASGAGDLKSYDWVIGPGDVDGDGHNDLVGRDSVGQLWLLPGTAAGLGTRRFIASGFGGYKAAG